MRIRVRVLAAVALCLTSATAALAQDLPTFRLECANGVFKPRVLQVPAGKKIKVEIFNTGTDAIEFESVQLRKEKALSPGANSFVVIYPLDPGNYPFFDDFHPQGGGGVIVAK